MARLTSLTKNQAAFLDTIGFSEGTLRLADNGYACLFGGGSFTSYAHHPHIAIMSKWGWTSAAGRYQILDAVPGKVSIDTWSWASRACNVTDFSPESQDKVCLYLVERAGALDDVNTGRFDQAAMKCNKTWASFPASPYNQPTNSLDKLRAYFVSAGGTLAS